MKIIPTKPSSSTGTILCFLDVAVWLVQHTAHTKISIDSSNAEFF